MDPLTNKRLDETINKESISLEVTTSCNSVCSHCFVRAAMRPHSQLTFKEAFSIIKEAFNLGFRTVHITGGEPLLWEPFLDFVQAAVEIGYSSIMCNSNGTLFNLENCGKLRANKDRLLFSVSLQGIGIHHDKIRGIGAWDMTTKGIQAALENDLQIIIFSVINKTLLSFLPEFIEFVYKKYKKIKHLCLIQLIRVMDDRFNLKDEMLSPEDFIKMIKIMSFFNLSGRQVSILENPLANILAVLLNMPWIPQTTPLYRPGRIMVLADKRITLSHSNDHSFATYSPGILEKTILSAEYKNYISPDQETCPDCKYYSLCARYNMTQPSEKNRHYDPDLPFCQKVLNMATSSIFSEVI